MTGHQEPLTIDELKDQIKKALIELNNGFLNSAICHLEYALQ